MSLAVVVVRTNSWREGVTEPLSRVAPAWPPRSLSHNRAGAGGGRGVAAGAAPHPARWRRSNSGRGGPRSSGCGPPSALQPAAFAVNVWGCRRRGGGAVAAGMYGEDQWHAALKATWTSVIQITIVAVLDDFTIGATCVHGTVQAFPRPLIYAS